jgi:hypothetical protein
MIKLNNTNKNMLKIQVFCSVTRSAFPDVSNESMSSHSTAEDSLKTLEETNTASHSRKPES